MADRGWKRLFDEPISLPRGRQLVTLEDAGTHITKLPKAEHKAAEWQDAMKALILVAESGGPTMFARIGIIRALNRHIAECDVKTSMTSVAAEWKIAEVFGIGTVDPGRACRRMVKCELAHNRFALFRCRIVKSRRVQAMIQQPAKGMPQCSR